MTFEEREAYDKGYKDGISDGNISNGTFAKRVKEAYENGLNTAWECARKIYLNTDENGLSGNALYAIFGEREGYILKEYSASEAIAKIKEYEEKQKADAEIKVGDEVVCKSPVMVCRAVVTRVLTDKSSVEYMNVDGCFGAVNTRWIIKTGRHFPQIAEMLKQMSEE